MRYLVLILAYATALLVTPAAAVGGDAVACYNIDNADARSYCLARAHRDPGKCYSIQLAYLRSLCLAEVGR